MQDIPVTYLTPEECSAGASSSLPLVDNKFPGDPFLTALIPLIKEHSAQLEQSMAISSKSKFTEMISRADNEFDSCFCSFKDYTEALAKLPIMPESAVAAQTIDAIITKHGRNLHTLGRQEQIGRMNALAFELNTPEMHSELQIAGLKPLYEMLIDKHEKLVGLYQLRATKEKTVNIQPPCEAKKVLAEDLSDLYNYFARFSRFGSDEYKETALQIQSVFAKIIPAARSRHSRGQTSQTPDTQESEVTATI
jgi:hypothetical protein